MVANSETAEAAEYDDTGGAETFKGESEIPSSKDSVNEAAGTPEVGFVETGRGKVGASLKLRLAGLTA
jgi:hypothetical protein